MITNRETLGGACVACLKIVEKCQVVISGILAITSGCAGGGSVTFN